MPKTLCLVLDNCVGQNKSQIVMMFFCFLSVTLYDKVVAHYPVSGHSHMPPDKTCLHAKRALGKENLFHPHDMLLRMNKVYSVMASYLDHTKKDCPFFDSWDIVFNDVMKPIPNIGGGGYTSCHFFEFEKGEVKMKRMCNTDDDDIIVHKFMREDTVEPFKKILLSRIFREGVNFSNATCSDILLTKTPQRELNDTKINSLSGKYFSIPVLNLPYYPPSIIPPEDILQANINNDMDMVANYTSQRFKDSIQKLKVGRPKKNIPAPALQVSNSILGFLKNGVDSANSIYKSRLIGIFTFMRRKL